MRQKFSPEGEKPSRGIEEEIKTSRSKKEAGPREIESGGGGKIEEEKSKEMDVKEYLALLLIEAIKKKHCNCSFYDKDGRLEKHSNLANPESIKRLLGIVANNPEVLSENVYDLLDEEDKASDEIFLYSKEGKKLFKTFASSQGVETMRDEAISYLGIGQGSIIEEDGVRGSRKR